MTSISLLRTELYISHLHSKRFLYVIKNTLEIIINIISEFFFLFELIRREILSRFYFDRIDKHFSRLARLVRFQCIIQAKYGGKKEMPWFGKFIFFQIPCVGF